MSDENEYIKRSDLEAIITRRLEEEERRKREAEEEIPVAAKKANRDTHLANARQNIACLPQCQIPSTLGTSARMADQFNFIRDLRITAGTVTQMMELVDLPTDQSEFAVMASSAQKLVKMLDLRLASFQAAALASTWKKQDFVEEYYTAYRSKVDKTTGKWATGEKDFADVDYDMKQKIDDRLVKMEEQRSRGNGNGHRSNRSNGNGYGGHRGGGAGFGGGRGGGRRGAAAPQAGGQGGN